MAPRDDSFRSTLPPRSAATDPRPPRVLRGLALGAFASTVALLLALPGHAVSTRTFVADSSADFAAGVLDRVAVTSDGSVVLGWDTQRIAIDPAAANVWSILDLGDGTALVGTGVDGRVYRIENGRASLYAETGQIVVTSLARGEDGTIYAATLPEGRIFRLRPPLNGRPQSPELHVRLPDTEHVWAIVWDRGRHALLAGTGPQGRLYAVDRAGTASVVFDSDEPHIYSLALAADGTIYAGAGGGHAILYAVRAPGSVRSVARFAGDEIRGIVIAGNEIFAAANEFTEPPEPPRRSFSASRQPAAGGPAPVRRPGRGSVHRVRANGTTERVYYNAESHVNALELDAQHGNELYAALGVNGRVIAIAPDRTSRIVLDVDEHSVLALDLTGRARLFGTGDGGAAYSLGTGRPTGATWTSRTFDAGSIARWGAVRARGTGTVEIEVRSGNADPPDSTWSAWSALTTEGHAQSPAARFLQLRARWSQGPDAILRALTAYYLPTNQRAVVTEVTTETKIGDPRPQSLRINWKVDNPDSDTLRYRIRFRGDGDQNWRTILRQGEFVTGANYDWPTDGLAEGFYRIQVEASDEASNPDNEVERDTRVSEPVLVDNTPPQLTVTFGGGRLRGTVSDGASAVTRVEYALDSQEWHPVRATDGVLDERNETFEVNLAAINDGGEHVVAVRAYDEANNLGVSSVRFRAAGTARP